MVLGNFLAYYPITTQKMKRCVRVAQVCSGLKVRRIDITFQCKPDGRKNKGHNCGRCIQQLLVETFVTLENGEYQLKGQRR